MTNEFSVNLGPVWFKKSFSDADLAMISSLRDNPMGIVRAKDIRDDAHLESISRIDCTKFLHVKDITIVNASVSGKFVSIVIKSPGGEQTLSTTRAKLYPVL